MRNKKGAELSMNVIIIAAIALLVLAILAYLLFNSAERFGDGTKCEGAGGECYPSACEGDHPIPIPGFHKDCYSGTGKCCIKAGSDDGY